MAATKWTGKAHNGTWFDTTNWSAGVPLAGDAARFHGGGTYEISLAGSNPAQAGSLSVLADILSFGQGMLNLDAPSPAHGEAVDLAIGQSGTVSIAADGTVTSQNTIEVGAYVSGALTPGALTVFGILDASVLRAFAGSVQVEGSAAHVTISQGQYISVGGASLSVLDGGLLDAGPNTLTDFYSYMDVGSGLGSGQVTVDGRHSTMTLAHISLGDGYDGSLTISNGGRVHAGVIVAGANGDGFVSVDGLHSTLTAINEIMIGNVNVLPVGSTISITDNGAVKVGTFGLDLQYGYLKLDSTAHLSGAIVSQVGQIEALASSVSEPGTVTLTQSITLQSNDGAQGQYDHNTTVSSDNGATLKLMSKISGQNYAILSAGSGMVVLGHAANTYAATSLYNAHLEIAANGAAGKGTLSFTGGSTQTPVLAIDAGVIFRNVIAGFGGHDTIDLAGFAFSSDITKAFSGGILKLHDGAATTTLHFAGNYAAANFVLLDDHAGGTAITFTG